MENKISRKKNPPTKKEIELANKLRAKRLENNLSLQEVADKLGISKVTVSRYETLDITNIPSDKIEGMAKLYNTTPAYLMGWEEKSNEETTKVESPRFRWVARNAKKMTDEELERLQKLMEVAFSEIDFDEED